MPIIADKRQHHFFDRSHTLADAWHANQPQPGPDHSSNKNTMSSPAPLLRPPVPGARSNSGSRTPRLTLGIPPSPSMKPVNQPNGGDADNNNVSGIPLPQPSTTRPAPPQLRLATPMLNTNASSDNARPVPQLAPLSIGGSTDNTGNGVHHPDGKNSGPTSASSSSYSALSFAMGLRQPAGGTPDPASAISSVYSDREGGVSMERDNSVNGLLPDLDKLSIDKGRPLDVEDLDDEGWLAASEQNKIDELGSLGEGAGGAVTRCKLKGGNTVFALKVFPLSFSHNQTLIVSDHHYRSESRREEADHPRTEFQQRLRFLTYLPLLWSFHGQIDGHDFHCHGVLRGR